MHDVKSGIWLYYWLHARNALGSHQDLMDAGNLLRWLIRKSIEMIDWVVSWPECIYVSCHFVYNFIIIIIWLLMVEYLIKRRKENIQANYKNQLKTEKWA